MAEEAGGIDVPDVPDVPDASDPLDRDPGVIRFAI